MNKFRKIYLPILIVVTVLVCAAGVGLRVKNLFGEYKFDSSSIQDYNTNRIEMQEFSSIVNEADITGLKIVHGTEYAISYRLPSGMQPEFEINDGVLYLNIANNVKFIHLSLVADTTEVVIEIPEGAELEKVDIVADAGSVDIEGIKIGNLDVVADAGSVIVENAQIEELSISTDAGSIILNDCSVGKGEIDTDAGGIESENTAFTSVEVLSSMGSIKFSNADFETGDFSADLGSIKVGGNFRQIGADCSMGSIDVDNAYEGDDAVYDLETDLGSVTLNGKNVGTEYIK